MSAGSATVHAFNEGRGDEGQPPMGDVVNEKMKAFFGYHNADDDEDEDEEEEDDDDDDDEEEEEDDEDEDEEEEDDDDGMI